MKILVVEDDRLPFRMALRNVFCDRKRTAIVMLSLFLSITVFTSIMTVINGIDIDNYINEEYNGITETSIARISSVGLRASESLTAYAGWVSQTIGLTAVVDGSFLNAHTIKGIDWLSFDEINASLPVPIDRESFERGEIAIINTRNADLVDYFGNVFSLEIKREGDTEYKVLPVGGVVHMPTEQIGASFSYSYMEIPCLKRLFTGIH